MLRTRLLITLLLMCGAVWCQDQTAAQYFGSEATPADLGISCSVNAADRTAVVTIVNRTEKRHYFQRSGPLLDYQATATSEAGESLPQLTQRQVSKQENPTGKIWNMTTSTALITLGPKEDYKASFPFRYHVAIPKEGGVFRVRIGQSLFSVENDMLRPNPAAVIWCDPVKVTFPPLH